MSKVNEFYAFTFGRPPPHLPARPPIMPQPLGRLLARRGAGVGGGYREDSKVDGEAFFLPIAIADRLGAVATAIFFGQVGDGALVTAGFGFGEGALGGGADPGLFVILWAGHVSAFVGSMGLI